MVLSLLVVLAVVGGFYLLRPPDTPAAARPVDSGDLESALAVAARAADWPVLDPVPALPEDWTLTVARTRLPDTAGAAPVVLELVLVTPADRFLAVTQTAQEATDVVVAAAGVPEPSGEEVDAGGQTWSVWSGGGPAGDEVAWTWTADGRTVVLRSRGQTQDLRAAAEAVAAAEPERATGP